MMFKWTLLKKIKEQSYKIASVTIRTQDHSAFIFLHSETGPDLLIEMDKTEREYLADLLSKENKGYGL